MNYIRTVDTNQDIPSGSIIVFNSQPETKWIIQMGPYMYAGQPSTGWHAKSLPSGAVLPINPAEFSDVTLISGGVCPPRPVPPKPGPGPGPGPMPPHPPHPYWNEAPNMITVQSVEERDRIEHRFLVDGKVVRVNNYNGVPEYFEWDEESLSWRMLNLGSRYYDKDETDKVVKDAVAWARIGDSISNPSESEV